MVHFDKIGKPPLPLDEDLIIERIGTNITDTDLKRYFGDHVGVMKYSDLANYNSLDELLPEDRDFKIILTEDSFNKGHWCCLLKYGKICEWFDPYGVRPDATKKLLGKARNMMLGQQEDYLTDLMKKSNGYKIIYNKKRFQKLKEGINTCGRWIILRIICMKDLGMDLKEFGKMVVKNQEGTGLPRDALVSIWIG